jgi:hypothetical protein
MPSRGTKTTLKISQRVVTFIVEKAREEESIDSVLRRLLGLKEVEYTPPSHSMMKLIKVSRDVMDYLQSKARDKESRDQTLGRLLGIPGDYGNLGERGEAPSVPSLPKAKRGQGNVRIKK